jgi:hypothetical protein
MRFSFAFALTAALSLLGCDSESEPPISQGLKIFVTAAPHASDFGSDPLLQGSNGIEKADAFCNADLNRPDGAIYKALLVDGVVRDALSRTNWVLQPSTPYYRTRGDVLIGTTTESAILPAYWAPLANSVGPPTPSGAEPVWVWTGIATPSDFAAGEHCNGWSTAPNPGPGPAGPPTAAFADSGATDASAFRYMAAVCGGSPRRIYCVQQP